jgi:hypothetical protein
MPRILPLVRLVCAVCDEPVTRFCDVVEWPEPASVNREAEGLCPRCMAWVWCELEHACELG